MVEFYESKPNIYQMIRLLILSALGIAIVLFIIRLFPKQRDDNVIDREVVDGAAKPKPTSLLTIFLLGAMLAGIVLFMLPRFGISVMGLFQKVMAFLPFIRGFLPL